MGGHKNGETVRFTGREHYISHLLLMNICEKFSDKKTYGKSVYSVLCFTMTHLHEDRYIIPSRMVDFYRKRSSGVKKGMPAHNKGKPMSDQAKQNMSNNHWLKRGGKHPLKDVGHRKDSIEKMQKHSVRNKWNCISPTGEIFENVSIYEMQRKFNINIDCVNRFDGRGVIPPPPKRVESQTKQSRHNTTGWSFYRVHS